MRKLVSAFLVAMMLVNLATWPSAALAEVLDHDQEASLDSGAGRAPAEPPAHSPHGCLGHYSQHFQGQVVAMLSGPRPGASDAIAISPEIVFVQHIPLLPLRPPLTATILS